MTGAPAWRRYLRLLRPDVRADVDDELAFHLEMRVRELVARGVPPAAARAEAERIFGDMRAVRDACVTIDERRLRRHERREGVDDMMRDFRFAARALRKSPGFTLTAIVCVALGVCVTTTIFSAVDGILIRPLPYPDADRLVAVYGRLAAKGATGQNISYDDYLSWRDENRTFSQLGIWTWTTHTLSGQGEAERVEGAGVSANLFPLLGVRPLLGRTIAPSEELPGNDRVILLSYGLWQRRFAGDRGIVGRTIEVDGLPYTVVGVMPPRFNFPDRGQVWVPFPNDAWRSGRGNRGYAGAIGRLKPGATLAQAQADLDVISRRLQRAYPRENFGWDAEAIALRDDLVGDLRKPLFIFLGAVGCVLLIACANVANLMLARGAARQREIAVRVALGAGRRRIVRQVLAESMVLALVGGAVGAVLARSGVRLLRLAFPNGDVPFYVSLDMDARVLLFAVLVSALTGVIFGLVPALRATRIDLNAELREGGRGEAGGRRGSRLRNSLVVAEVALSVVLLVGATLLLRSYGALIGTDLGFDPRGVLTARVSLPDARYDNHEKQRAFYEQLYARLAAIPGVQAVGSANGIPFSGWNVQAEMSIEGRPAAAPGKELVVHYQNISPGYLPAIGVPIVRGRGFTAADRDSAHIGVINDVLARREFAGTDPIGKRIRFGGADSKDPWITIIGVAKTFRHYRLPQPMGPAIYFPQLATPWGTQTLALRTSLPDPMSLAPAVRAVLKELDPDVPAYQVQTLEQAVSRSLWRQRLQGQVLGTFAALALLLAAVGIYGVISYAVAQRTRELGVRMALGATRSQVLGLVLGQGLRLAAAGVAIGIVAALALSRIVASLLYGVSATDLATFAGVPIALALVAMLATLVPARRATRVDPVVAMRTE
ncbi:MAG TPA: ABC transporter permease [Gemmatimonadaceae bacterium]